ncbi:sporulation histidine kinase inhibitor Sda [Bacillus sp. JCM 19034]|uniref:sporulation histidine kinase inhibitor Sda n=1 Tax=Bacillus sp. JCM 19034 TaxID=1481928 RepID=UPI000783F1AE|nr:sporulation histidine kinase inhibitor Sda [Bacillus sp. JCM 19034]
MHKLTDEQLLHVYFQAKREKLPTDFILLIADELKRRNLESHVKISNSSILYTSSAISNKQHLPSLSNYD